MTARPPDFYLQMKQQHPEFFAAVEALGQAVRGCGPLDEKTVQLVQLAAAAAMRSEGAVHSHARRALDAGVSIDAVRHALICLASTIGFPNVTAALSWTEDVLKTQRRKTDHA